MVVPSSYTTISDNAFQESSIESIDLSKSQITTLSDNCMQGCTSLKSIVLPPSLETIGYCSLSNASITQLVLPDTVKTIKAQGLYLSKLQSIYISTSVEFNGDYIREI